jgi:hypothetical protein
MLMDRRLLQLRIDSHTALLSGDKQTAWRLLAEHDMLILTRGFPRVYGT